MQKVVPTINSIQELSYLLPFDQSEYFIQNKKKAVKIRANASFIILILSSTANNKFSRQGGWILGQYIIINRKLTENNYSDERQIVPTLIRLFFTTEMRDFSDIEAG